MRGIFEDFKYSIKIKSHRRPLISSVVPLLFIHHHEFMAASSTDISRQLRLLLTNSPDAPALSSFLETVDALVAECLHAQNSAGLLEQLEEDLQSVYHDVIDHSESSHSRIFLSVLYRLRSILPPVSIISTWFDLVLRPAIREPKLPPEAVAHAKELIVSALSPVKRVRDAVSDEPDKEKRREKIKEFRRRLMDLYLLDAYNESSGEEVLEWAELDDAQKEVKACWKANLEDVLVKIGLQRPQVGLVSSVWSTFRPHAKSHAHDTRTYSRSSTIASHPQLLDCSYLYCSMRIHLSQVSLHMLVSSQTIPSCKALSTA